MLKWNKREELASRTGAPRWNLSENRISGVYSIADLEYPTIGEFNWPRVRPIFFLDSICLVS